MTSVVRRRQVEGRPPRIVVAQPSLLFSDDYLDGWVWGFQKIGCEVHTVDISMIKRPLRGSRRSTIVSSVGDRVIKPLAQSIAKLEPDLVFCHHGRAASHEVLQGYLRSRGIPTAVYLCDEPYECGETLQYAPRFDYVFTMDPGTLEAHKIAKGNRDQVFYLPPGVNTDRFNYVPYHDRTIRHQALFLGNASLSPRPEFFKPVEELVDRTAILYWKSTNKQVHKDRWIPFPHHPQLYTSCLVGLNVHRDPRIGPTEHRDFVVRQGSTYPKWPGLQLMQGPPRAGGTGFWNVYDLPAQHVNPRFFEMAACGTCVINDDARNELRRLFPMAPCAMSPEEFLRLVLRYIEKPEEAAEVGAECAVQIFKRHTYAHRAAEILLRVGLKGSIEDSLSGSLGEPEEWLTTQDFDGRGINQSSGPIGSYGPYDRLTGRSWIRESGKPSAGFSLRMVPPWSC